MKRFIATLVIAWITFISSFLHAAPAGYNIVSTRPGWTMYQKGSDNNIVYVQEIDINKVRIDFMDNGQSPDNSSLFKTDSIASMWSRVSQRAYAITNGAFFNQKPTEAYNSLAFGYKRSGTILSYGTETPHTQTYDMKMLSQWYNTNTGKYVIQVTPYNDSLFKSKNQVDVLVGLDPYFKKGDWAPWGESIIDFALGRTFVGVINNSTLYIMNAKQQERNWMIKEMAAWGMPDNQIIQFDGSGSSQLIFKSWVGEKQMYGCTSRLPGCGKAGRLIPQTIVVMPR